MHGTGPDPIATTTRRSGTWQLGLAAAAVGYLAGLVPSATVAARLASRGQVDLRAAGTGNPGGANAAAVLGRRWGYAVMAADIAKGAVACRIGRRLAGDSGQHVAGVAAVVGHCYPMTHRFRGGKTWRASTWMPMGSGRCSTTAASPRSPPPQSVIGQADGVEDAAAKMAAEILAAGDLLRVGLSVADPGARPIVDAFRRILDAAPADLEVLEYRVGPSVGAHTGPGTAGAVYHPI